VTELPHEGRVNQKRRTRDAILATAVDFLEQGRRPTVSEVADAALVSRATAYRYFPSQDFLLMEATLESTRSDIDRQLEESGLPEHIEERLDILVDLLQERIAAKESAFRALLKLSLEQSATEGPSPRAGFRGAGRVRWIELVLDPVRGRLSPPDFQRLVAALSLCMGIEPFVVLHDVCGLEVEECGEVLRWTGRMLLRSSLKES
jgi:AcrR family transcriptional regulator